MTHPDLIVFDQAYAQHGRLCGVDEVGRGPIAGPVVAAAVILDPTAIPEGLRDSKKISAGKRGNIARAVRRSALAFAVAQASVHEIDALDILKASHLAMRRAVADLPLEPDFALVDGNRDPGLACVSELCVGGDDRSASIAAASILAKVARDAMMDRLAETYPDYGWQSNRGYPSRAHLDALNHHGPTPHHRMSFAPLRKFLSDAPKSLSHNKDLAPTP